MILFIPTAYSQGGRIDKTFSLRAAAGADVAATAVLSDGKILIAGKFSVTDGVTVRRDVVRLNADGSIDPTFDAGTGVNVGSVLAIGVQPDGKILAGGPFSIFNGVDRSALVRLNSDGSVDESLALSGINVTFVFDVDVLPDGKIFISALNAIGSSFIARLTSSGMNDTGFGQPFYSGAWVERGFRIAFLSSENMLLVGAIRNSGPSQGVVMKMALTGGVDNNFVVPLNLAGPNFLEVDVMPIANGKVLAWGRFDSVDQVARRNIAMINSDRTVDPTFEPQTASTGTVMSAAVQADGKIVIGGRNFLPNGLLHGNLGRLNMNGSVDQTFNPGRGSNGAVKSLRIIGTKLLVGGDFFRYDRAPLAGLVRVKL